MKKTWFVCALAVLLTCSTATAAQADEPPPPTATQLAAALDLPGGVTAGLEGPAGSAVVESAPFNDFPRSSGSGYVVLSSGLARHLIQDVPGSRQPSTNLPGEDRSTLRLDVDSSPGPRCLKVDVAMATEELVAHYTTATPSDGLSIRRAGDPGTEHAMHPGKQFLRQATSLPEPVRYEVNAIGYWHRPGDVNDRDVGEVGETPWAPASASPFDHVTTVETMEVPLPAGAAETVEISVADVGNDLLDTAAIVDAVRVVPRCSDQAGLDTGLILPDFAVVGDRGVGNTLTVDLKGSTEAIERYDAADNGWFAGSDRGVDVRFRWYQHKTQGGGTKCLSTDMRQWTPIANADRQSFVPGAAQKNFCLVALVTGKKDGWRSETYPSPNASSWNPTLPIGNGVFVRTQQPGTAISRGDGYVGPVDGPPAVGDTVVAKPRDFVPRQDTFQYQWFAAGSTIVGATGPEFVVTDQQAAKALTVRVTAQRLNFDPRPATSPPTDPVVPREMTETPEPTISGRAVVGETVSAVPGTWQPTPSSFAYQWSLDGQVLTSARQATYKIRPEDSGKQLSVSVTGSLAGFRAVTRTSPAATVGAAPMPGATPTITGTAQVGQRLTATVTGWEPTGSTLTFTWRAGGTVLQSGASRQLVVPGAAAGRTITVAVEGVRPGYVTTTRTSTPTRAVAAGVLTTTTPRIVGRAKVGVTLRATPGSWGPAGVKLTYQWYANGSKVKGATKSAWKVTKAVKGKRLTVKVTGTLTGFTTRTRTSAGTAKVAK